MTAIMGITWVFGYLLLVSSDPVYVHVMSWIFATLNTLQVCCLNISITQCEALAAVCFKIAFGERVLEHQMNRSVNQLSLICLVLLISV